MTTRGRQRAPRPTNPDHDERVFRRATYSRDEDRRDPRGHAADPLEHPQRLHRLLEDDAQPRRGRHRRGARRPPVVGYGFNSNGRYGQGALMRERFIPRILEAAPETLRRRRRRQSRPAQDLGDDDDQREAGRPRRALGRGRHDRHGGLGRGREDRRQAALPAARRSLRRRHADRERLRLCRRRLLLSRQGPRRAPATRCAATSIAATRS